MAAGVSTRPLNLSARADSPTSSALSSKGILRFSCLVQASRFPLSSEVSGLRLSRELHLSEQVSDKAKLLVRPGTRPGAEPGRVQEAGEERPPCAPGRVLGCWH